MNGSMIRSGLFRGRGRRTTASLLLSRRTQAATFATDDNTSDKAKKENFAKKFLEPAARGELQNHQSGIPKLAVRKPKGHAVKDSFPGKESEEILKDALNVGGNKNVTATSGRQERGGTARINKGTQQEKRVGNIKQQQQKKAPEMTLAPLFEGVKPEELDPTLTNNNLKWLGPKNTMQQNLFRQQRNVKQRNNQGGGRDGRPKYDIWGDEVLEGDTDHPWVTDAMHFKHVNPHTESKREPKPTKFPTNRFNPPAEFVEAHGAFAYVINVPRPVVDGELGSSGNPLHRHEVVEFVANVFSVPATDVFCANMTSAFVGFTDAKEAAEAIVKSEKKRIITGNKIESTIYSSEGETTDDETEFVKSASSPDSILQLQNLPAGIRAGTIARLLRDAGAISDKDVFMSSPYTALIRTSSPEVAKTLLDNNDMHKTLASLQRQILRVLPARREVVHDKFAGPVRKIQMKKMTHKLIVHGDVPSRDFFLSHAKVLHLINVPEKVSKKEISESFQKFCAERRDVEGSIEIVKSSDGHPTGRVYVGFDLEREGDDAWNEISSSGEKIVFNETAPATRVMQVKEVALVRGSKLGARSERTQEELIASFSAWKDYVDPKDMETLESFGITMDVLGDAFKAARHSNPTFGVEDQAREGERMRDEYAPGGHFREFVQMYIDTLKEVGATKEEPGLKYESMFLPGEELEYTLFDDEEERLAALKKEHGN
jgi:hypothetical protein